MKKSSKSEEEEKNRFDGALTKIWNNPVGKASVIAVAFLGIVLAVGGIFKAGAFTLNAYKDFRDANRR